MRYLQGLNWLLLAVGALMSLILSVVLLIYFLYVGEAPRLRATLPLLIETTLIFMGLAAVAAAAALGMRSHVAWRWPAQIALLAVVLSISWRYWPE